MDKNSFLSQKNRNSKKDKLIVRLLSVACLVGGFQVATQYFAHQFNYQPQLFQLQIETAIIILI